MAIMCPVCQMGYDPMLGPHWCGQQQAASLPPVTPILATQEDIRGLQARITELERKVHHLEQQGYNGRIEDAHMRIGALEHVIESGASYIAKVREDR